MEKDKARFGSSHFCAGCPVSDKLHIGCVVDASVVIVKNRGEAAASAAEVAKSTESLVNTEKVVLR